MIVFWVVFCCCRTLTCLPLICSAVPGRHILRGHPRPQTTFFHFSTKLNWAPWRSIPSLPDGYLFNLQRTGLYTRMTDLWKIEENKTIKMIRNWNVDDIAEFHYEIPLQMQKQRARSNEASLTRCNLSYLSPYKNGPFPYTTVSLLRVNQNTIPHFIWNTFTIWNI